MFYLYCVKLNQPEQSFFKSAFVKIIMVIDEYLDELERRADVKRDEKIHEVETMNEMRRIISGRR